MKRRPKPIDSEGIELLARYIARWLSRHAAAELDAILEQESLDDKELAFSLRSLFMSSSAKAMGDTDLYCGLGELPELATEDLDIADGMLAVNTDAATNPLVGLWPLVMRSAGVVNWLTVVEILQTKGINSSQNPSVKGAMKGARSQ